MSDLQVIVRNDVQLRVLGITEEARQLRDNALAASALVGKVDSDETNAVAVVAQKELKAIISMVESDRKTVKEPVLNFGKLIDSTAKEFVAEVIEEYDRTCRLTMDYAAARLAQARAAEAARVAELSRLDRERQEALAKATTLDQRDEVNNAMDAKAAAMPVKVFQQPKGQVVREDWEFEVTDVHMLYRMHPNMVDLTPRRSAIREALFNGLTVAGVNARKVVKTGVTNR